MGGTPYDLAVDSGGDLFPVTGPAPRLSWKIPADTTAPYELEATIDGVLQPAATTDQRLYVTWPWQALRSRQRVQWRVRGAATGGWSAWSGFEAGLPGAGGTAWWISRVDREAPGNAPRPAYILSTHFELPG